MTISERIITLAAEKSALLGTAESCTGGMIGAALTDIAGSSIAVDRGFITYSNDAKITLLGVAADVITTHGAVSQEVVEAMAIGAAEQIQPASHRIAVSVSGVAGPGGGSAAKPVGTVWFGLAHIHGDQRDVVSQVMRFDGGRADVRQSATDFALKMIEEALIAI